MNFLYRIQTKDNTLFLKTRTTQDKVYKVYCLNKQLFLCFLKKEVLTANITSTALKYFDSRAVKGYYLQLFVMSQHQLSVEEVKKLTNKIFHAKALDSNSIEKQEKQKLIQHAFSVVK